VLSRAQAEDGVVFVESTAANALDDKTLDAQSTTREMSHSSRWISRRPDMPTADRAQQGPEGHKGQPLISQPVPPIHTWCARRHEQRPTTGAGEKVGVMFCRSGVQASAN
jgi:hypothetical protein